MSSPGESCHRLRQTTSCVLMRVADLRHGFGRREHSMFRGHPGPALGIGVPGRRTPTADNLPGPGAGQGEDLAMLVEARRRAAARQQVIVGWLEQHQRPDTIDQGREPWRPNQKWWSSTNSPHSTPDGSRSRWMVVAELIESGIDVLTTVNVANLVSTRSQ